LNSIFELDAAVRLGASALPTPKIPAVRDECSARHRRAADFLDLSTESFRYEIDAVTDDAATGCNC
jgi:hypothetical protein